MRWRLFLLFNVFFTGILYARDNNCDKSILIKFEGSFQQCYAYPISSKTPEGLTNGLSLGLTIDASIFPESKFFGRLTATTMNAKIFNVSDQKLDANIYLFGMGIGRRSKFKQPYYSGWWAIEGGPIYIKSKERLNDMYLSMKQRPYVAFSVGIDYSFGKCSAIGVFMRDIIIGRGKYEGSDQIVSINPFEIGLVYTFGFL